MPIKKVYRQFKDYEIGRPELDELLGATHGLHEPGTILEFECRGASRDALRKAERISAEGTIQINIKIIPRN